MSVIWYPVCDKPVFDYVMADLLKLQEQGRLTMSWQRDQNGQYYIDIQEIEKPLS